MLDPAHCLLPFPSDHFTIAAPAGSPQAASNGGTGRRINFNILAMPKNVVGKPIDPTEWNRNDGFSPGEMIITYVPDIGTVKGPDGKALGPIKGAVPITNLPAYLKPDAPIMVLDANTGQRWPIWAEIDLNAGLLLPNIMDQKSLTPKHAALIVRPAENFIEGHRYVVVLRNLQDNSGKHIAAQAPFAACRDHSDVLALLPPLQARCSELERYVFPVLTAAGVQRDDSLYLAWSFTVASAKNNVSRLVHMRDDAFALLGEKDAPDGRIMDYGRAPAFRISSVQDDVNDYTARRVQGTISVPSYVVPADPSPLDAQQQLLGIIKQLGAASPDLLGTVQDACAQTGIPLVCDVLGLVGDTSDAIDLVSTGNLPPNRLFYNPLDGLNLNDPLGSLYGDGLPDRNPLGNLTFTFTCDIPYSALGGKGFAQASAADVTPVRPTLYGHGLLGSQGEVNGQASDFGNLYGFMNCAADWFGFATGDLPNIIPALLDLSFFPVLPDATQQGMLNQMFLARLLVHPNGFAANPVFQVDGRPVFDYREVFYHGNSQGGILGGALVAISKDINRGVLGVPGMNYSTLLQRSTDFATYSVPLYLAYPRDLDRVVNFALMQMLWDRGENNGYAEHISDNSAMGGPDNQLILNPALGDHQVSMWTADVMARTIGASVDRRRVTSARHPDQDSAEYAFLEVLDYSNPAQIKGSALVPYDEDWLSTHDARCAGQHTQPPPIGNVPPGAVAGDDPHECPRRDPQARCQASNFLQRTHDVAPGNTLGRLIDPALASRSIDSATAGCPAVINPDAPSAAGTYTDPGAGLPLLGGVDNSAFGNEGYGTGLFAVVGRLFANLQRVLSALLQGDVDTAAAMLASTATALGEDVAKLPEQVDNPEALVGLHADLATVLAQALGANRAVEPVVLSGAQIPDWSALSAVGAPYPYPSGAMYTGALPPPLDDARDAHNGIMLYPLQGATLTRGVPVDDIAAWRWAGDHFEEIPVQVDERYPYFLANGNSGFSTYSGTDEELTYAWDTENWNATDAASGCQAVYPPGKSDPVAGLDNDDQIVFMARDAGPKAPTGALPNGAASVHQVLLVDALDPLHQRVVYLGTKPGGSAFRGQQHYVHYQRDANADQWIDAGFYAEADPDKLGTSNTSYGPNLEGTVCPDGTPASIRYSDDRFPRDGVTVTTPTYQWYASGRWMIRSIRIKRPQDSTAATRQPGYWASRPDIIDRWKGRAFQQSPDSAISLVGFEDEQVNWEANAAELGELCGPVRCIREIWGADSGTNVTKTETFYRDLVTYRYHVRVHPIPPDGLYTSWDYNRSAMVSNDSEVPGGRFYTLLRPQGVPIDGVNDDIGQIDDLPFCKAFFDQAPPQLQRAALALVDALNETPLPAPSSGDLQRCAAFIDVSDPLFNLPLAFDSWNQVSAKGDYGSLVYTFQLTGLTSLANPLVVPYYRDDACLDDGTGDDPVQRPWPGEPSTDARVIAGYTDIDGNGQVDCYEKQGAYGSSGIHFFLTLDSDNAFVVGKPIDEIDGTQWQFMVPTGAPKNVAEPYANVMRVPLLPVVAPVALANLLPTG